MPVLMSVSTPPPSNEKAEATLLAALFPPQSVNPAALGVQPHHFADPVNGMIFRVAMLHAEQGRPIAVLGLAADLQAELEEVGGTPYLHQLSMLEPRFLPKMAESVRDAWTRRQLIDLGERLRRVGEELVQGAFGFTSRAPAPEQAAAAMKALEEAAAEAGSIVNRMGGEAHS